MLAASRLGARLIGLLFLVALGGANASQHTKEALFQQANGAFEAARAAQADVYAPKSYTKAIKYYRSAERKFASGQNSETVRAELALATEQFQQAVETSRAAQTEFASTLKARADAEKTKAPAHANDLWRRAEQRLERAISDFERDASGTAAQRAAEAEQLYREAELGTIKRNLLDELRLALTQAEQAKVERYAPKTLQKAKDLMAQAEQALEKDRYDADRPRSLVQRAMLEVKRANYIAEAVRQAKAEKLTPEDLILRGEKPLRQITAAADISASFEGGFEEPTKKIIARIEGQDERAQRLQQSNDDLKTEVAQLQEQLSNASDERTALSERLRAQVQRREALERQTSSLQAEVQQLHLSLGGVSEERGALADRLRTQAQLRENLHQEVSTLRREIEVLEQILDNVSKERDLLAKRVDAQARMRDQFAQVESMFSPQEARIFRQSNDVIVRLVGLSFPPGEAKIQSQAFDLLAKLAEAIRVFPQSTLTVEGHTDSFGSDAANLVLSQKRADAVKDYLVANMRLDPATVQAVGYGETRPVANNETKEGRAKNRRIDVLVSPKPTTE
jgi:outer membrane protein OmpA-like peptidoglycan-associated protein